MQIIVARQYSYMKDSLIDIVENFDADGETIYKGRNTLKTFKVGSTSVVVKRFKPLDVVKGIIYTFFRKTKACRSYVNSVELNSRGIDTPAPIAYIERRKWGLVCDTYYICMFTDYEEIATQMNVTEDYNPSLAEAYGFFAADLHAKGILHYDLNSGNVLFKKAGDGSFQFQLIDVNRMKFMPEGTAVGMSDCLENLTLFTGNMRLHAKVAECYARHRGLNVEEFVAHATKHKRLHDRKWRIRKAILHPLRTLSVFS